MPSTSLRLEVLYFEEVEDCLHIKDNTSISISYYSNIYCYAAIPLKFINQHSREFFNHIVFFCVV